MMNKKRTREIGRTKYLMFLPLAALLMIISNIEAVARTTKEVTKDVIEAVEENLTPNPATQTASVADEPAETPLPQQDKDKLVAYQGQVVDKDGKPVAGAKLLIDGMHKLPQNQSFVTDKNGKFSFKAFENARIAVHWSKDSKYMLEPVLYDGKERNNLKVVMNGEWQNPPANDPDHPVYDVVEVMPQYPEGGMPGMMQYLAKNIRYPANAQKNGIQGRVTVKFVVNKDGSLSDVGIIRGVNPELDAEAIRVISAMPKWKPGMQKGKPVRVRFTVPVMFKLTDAQKEYKTIQKFEEVVVVGTDNGKEGTSEKEAVFEAVEQMPAFPGGMTGLMNFLSKNIKYPKEAQKKGLQGQVIVRVVIDTNGNVTSPQIIKGVDPILDAEAIRVVSLMPRWQPGKQKGQPVNVRYAIPLMFRLP